MHNKSGIHKVWTIFFVCITLLSFFAWNVELQAEQNFVSSKPKETTIQGDNKHSPATVTPTISQKSKQFPWDPLINIAGIIIGVLLIVWQMHRQHTSNLNLQKDNHRDNIRLKVYKELATDISAAMQMYCDAHGLASQTIMQYRNCLIAPTFKTIRVPHNKLNDAHYAFLHSIAHLMCKIEEYEIVNNNLSIFRAAFTSTSYNTREAFIAFQQLIFKYMRFDVPEDSQESLGTDKFEPEPPTKKDLEQIDQAYNNYESSLIESYCYISDLLREAQNILLGEIFNNTVPPRKPLDKSLIVVTTSPDDQEKLRKYFEEESPYGVNHKQILSEHGII